MKRPALVSITAVTQSVLGALILAIAIYILVLSRSPKILADKDAPEAIKGMLIAAAVLGCWAVLAFILSAGLWRKRRWGWWLALVFNMSTAALILSDSIDGSKGRKFSDTFMYFLRDFEDWSPALIFIAIVVIQLLPSVRQFYFGSQPTVATNTPEPTLMSERH